MDMYLNKIVWYLAAQSWQIALVALAVATATFILRRRSAHVRYLLWLIVVVKCLVPPLHMVPLRVRSTIPCGDAVCSVISHVQWIGEPRVPALATSSGSLPQDAAPMPGVSPFPGYRLSPLGWLGVLWLAGAGVYLMANLLRAVRGTYWLHRTRRPFPEEALPDATDLLRAYGVRRLPKIWILEGVGQPFVWGWLRGSIYVPPGFRAIDRPEHRRDILAHELSHVVRCDPAVNGLQIVAQGLFWFHPLVWWANAKVRQEREKCCDETVIARLHTAPKDYSTAIVETLARAGESVRPVPSLAVASPLKHIEERLTALLRPGRRFCRRPSLIAAGLVILTALLAVPTAVVLTAQPMYVVSGTIHIAPTESSLWDSGSGPFDRNAYAIFMRTQAVLLSGDASLLSKVADDLESRGLAFFSSAKTLTIGDGQPPSPRDILRRAVVDGTIRIAPLPDTELLEVTMTGENEEEAKAIVNSFLHNYVAQYGVNHTSLEAQTIMELEHQQSELHRRILEARTRLRDLMRSPDTTGPASSRAEDPDLQDLQSRLKLDQEFHEKISRRLHQMEMELDRSPRVRVATPAEVKSR